MVMTLLDFALLSALMATFMVIGGDRDVLRL